MDLRTECYGSRRQSHSKVFGRGASQLDGSYTQEKGLLRLFFLNVFHQLHYLVRTGYLVRTENVFQAPIFTNAQA